jgi:hypothetical protein
MIPRRSQLTRLSFQIHCLQWFCIARRHGRFAFEYESTRSSGACRYSVIGSEAGVAAQGLAAAEVVAGLHGAPSASLQHKRDRRNVTLSIRIPPRLERIAFDAVDNIATASELREPWEETAGGLEAWLVAPADLRNTLAGPVSS